MGNRSLRILLRVALAVSLILNAAMFGVLLRLDNMRDQLGYQRATAAPEIRREFLALAREDNALRTALEDVGTARSAMMEMLQSTPRDRAAIEAQMSEVRRSTQALQIEAQRLLLDAAEASD